VAVIATASRQAGQVSSHACHAGPHHPFVHHGDQPWTRRRRRRVRGVTPAASATRT